MFVSPENGLKTLIWALDWRGITAFVSIRECYSRNFSSDFGKDHFPRGKKEWGSRGLRRWEATDAWMLVAEFPLLSLGSLKQSLEDKNSTRQVKELVPACWYPLMHHRLASPIPRCQ